MANGNKDKHQPHKYPTISGEECINLRRKKGEANLNGLEGEQNMGLGLGKNAATFGGSMLDGPPIQTAHSSMI